MAAIQQSLRDHLLYASGYLKGRSFTVPTSFSQLYGVTVARFTNLLSLPLPFLSFLALPVLGTSTTTINLVFFYLTWSALVLSHDQLTVELYGTLAIRLLCFVLPACGFLGFDCLLPSLSKSFKNRGASQSPLRLGRKKLLEIVGFSLLNVCLALVLQAALEFFFTDILRTKSILKVTSAVPWPLTILKDVAKGFAIRSIVSYLVHRFLLHTYDSPLKTWHLQWQHSVRLPFSLVAAYDHPVNYLLGQWLPTYLPAYLFRFHVLTWHLFIALCSLEELFVYSGYAVLPSSIVLVGMARRTDEHFDVVYDGKEAGNFGRFGILDFVCGTTCAKEDDAVDDIQAEAEKHNVQDRAEGVMDGIVSGVKGRKRPNTRAQRKKS
ncbi:uncharacterized protein LTR77_006538 [Saxophila tyrrhenica]|uniref:Fatty acid hydroxylase domain-containing protein n=1 Tax=Saxophila tyrrhenica TaxID=1690608 RepID=A0AAV9P977_9PEZI|nr:hypothetical protein LTR77_006538 [Saxophila tyrrhenica]